MSLSAPELQHHPIRSPLATARLADGQVQDFQSRTVPFRTWRVGGQAGPSDGIHLMCHEVSGSDIGSRPDTRGLPRAARRCGSGSPHSCARSTGHRRTARLALYHARLWPPCHGRVMRAPFRLRLLGPDAERMEVRRSAVGVRRAVVIHWTRTVEIEMVEGTDE